MKSLDLKTMLLGGSLLAGTFAYSTIGYAQETPVVDEDDVIELVDESVDKVDKKDTIIVTGSRIKRDTFSSISPLQVITADTSIKAGLIDPAQILQQSESASGTQIDATFNGFVLNNGPNSQTLNLRGLDATRTLVLINGRRFAPAGVEGAPSNASINQIPGSLIDRYDLLLDGASSIYGSDAVAGVANVILRKDFDGFEVIGNGSIVEAGGNTNYTIAGNWGGNNDRGFIGVGVEYDFRDEIRLFDSEFLSGCNRNVEITDTGEIRHRDIFDQTRYDVWFGDINAAESTRGPLGECVPSRITNRIQEFSRGFRTSFGSIYGVDGPGNIGIPGYVDQTFQGIPIDANGDGVQDFGFQEFSTNGTVDRTFISEQKRASLMAYGEYTLEGDMNVTSFFEALYVDTSGRVDTGQPQLFPFVGAGNQFSPCGTSAPTDCGEGVGDVVTDPAFVRRWGQYYTDTDPNRDGDTSDQRICAALSIPASVCTPAIFGWSPATRFGPVLTRPVVGVRGDRNNVETTQKNLRLVGGFKGDLPQLSFGSLSNWSFETSLTHSRSVGTSVRRGIREDRLNFSLGNNFDSGFPNNFPNGSAPCTAAPGQVVRPDVIAGCVPVNLFAPTLTNVTSGDFATQAERDYLFDERTFETIYKQTVWNTSITGVLADLPAGNLSAAFGAEYRIDDLESLPNDVASEGLLWGFFADAGAVGKKATRELFAEFDVPIIADKTFFRKLEMNISARLTDDEFYGTNYTYAIKGGWRPIDSLLLKASFGTSFRAPNLRENFLRGQSGFGGLLDPCLVPASARQAGVGGGLDTYDAANDFREVDTLARCVREGLDPTSLGLNTIRVGFQSTEVSSSGSFNLDPETSSNLNIGFSYEQPFTDMFDLDIGANYYRIEVKQGIIEPSGQFILNQCFLGDQPVSVRSQLCDNIGRDGNQFVDIVNAGFANIADDVVSGFDINARLAKDFNAFDKPMDFSLNLRVNNIQQRYFIDLDDNGNANQFDFEGRFGFPEWTGNLRADLNIDDKWNVSWTTRFIGKVQNGDPDPFGDALGTSGALADTCGGTFVGDVTCRDVNFAGTYYVHAASVGYRADTWRVTAGLSNIFNTAPPLVDGSEVLSIANVPIGNGYDLFGRRFFINASKSF